MLERIFTTDAAVVPAKFRELRAAGSRINSADMPTVFIRRRDYGQSVTRVPTTSSPASTDTSTTAQSGA